MPYGIYLRTNIAKENMSKSHNKSNSGYWLGKKRPIETREKMSKAKLGKPSPMCGVKRSKEFCERQKVAQTGRIASEESKIKNGLTHRGMKRTDETRKKMSLRQKGKPHLNQRGDKHPLWKGGISSENEKIRGSLKYKLWQDSVKNRDNNKCQKCEENRVSKLMGHHILNFSDYPKLRLTIDNGVTLCRDCHKKFHMNYGFKSNTREQLEEFLTDPLS